LTASAPVLYYALTGKLDQTALFVWTICILYFVSSVFFVKMLIGRLANKTDSGKLVQKCITYHLLLCFLLLLSLSFQWISILIAFGFLPIILRTIWGIRVQRMRLNFTKIGIAEFAYTLIFLIFTIAGLSS
jgi:hypothetical protein